MKVLWICGLPAEVQREVLGGKDFGSDASWSWIMAHLPPPPGVELHIACRVSRGCEAREFTFRGAVFHLVPVKSRGRVFCLFHFDWRYFHPLADRLKPDVIHGWGTEDAYGRVALKLAPERHVVGVQGILKLCRERGPMSWKTWFAAHSEALVLSKVSQVVAENEFSRDAVKSLLGRGTVEVVEHPLRDVFLGAPSDGSAQTVLFLGAIEERKGVWDALEAFRRSAPAGWNMVVIGAGTPRDMNRVQQQVAAPELKGRVTYLPSVTETEIAGQMRNASVLLLPTWVDTGPTTLKEALVMGLWPVCYDNTGPAHYLRKFGVGRLVTDRNVELLSKALTEELAQKPWLQPKFRDQVRTEIRPCFDRSTVWQRLVAVYRKVAGAARFT